MLSAREGGSLSDSVPSLSSSYEALTVSSTLPVRHGGSGGNSSSISGRRNRTDDDNAASSSQGQRPGRPEHRTGSGPSAKYKTSRRPPPEIKVRKRVPWGMQQLRDSWSTDAMTKGDRENMSERIHREYRYHPEEFRRHHIKFAAFLTIPAIMFGTSSGYYYYTGRPIWEGDPQYILNMIRQMDTSPRSRLHAYKLEGTEELPAHVKAYREKNWKKRLELEGCDPGNEKIKEEEGEEAHVSAV
ncbi:hypothetical protein DQ04_14531000 [Trypanosoma grayi]|uniref:hypothetical protein n=1 Tax=Trypanosoma grayi TaxID=71804 RepID=UPI0004F425C0|nr:hypothetical protein DQ04_14531000 [Trypanosoma grayi]KEG06339.1 hypothetical protein DQ04_14531000 [Trypanosoma grayi]